MQLSSPNDEMGRIGWIHGPEDAVDVLQKAKLLNNTTIWEWMKERGLLLTCLVGSKRNDIMSSIVK